MPFETTFFIKIFYVLKVCLAGLAATYTDILYNVKQELKIRQCYLKFCSVNIVQCVWATVFRIDFCTFRTDSKVLTD